MSNEPQPKTALEQPALANPGNQSQTDLTARSTRLRTMLIALGFLIGAIALAMAILLLFYGHRYLVSFEDTTEHVRTLERGLSASTAKIGEQQTKIREQQAKIDRLDKTIKELLENEEKIRDAAGTAAQTEVEKQLKNPNSAYQAAVRRNEKVEKALAQAVSLMKDTKEEVSAQTGVARFYLQQAISVQKQSNAIGTKVAQDLQTVEAARDQAQGAATAASVAATSASNAASTAANARAGAQQASRDATTARTDLDGAVSRAQDARHAADTARQQAQAAQEQAEAARRQANAAQQSAEHARDEALAACRQLGKCPQASPPSP